MIDQWRTIERIFHGALELPEPERAAFIVGSCDGDRDLIGEIESLLKHHGANTTRFESAVRPVASHFLKTRAPDNNMRLGAMLGPYRIERKLGEGGMGSVYAATDTRLGRQVAVKIVDGPLADRPEARARFLREARSAAALTHANIAVVYDFGEIEERPWLVMEYVAGVSLRSKLLAGPVGEIASLNYGAQIAAALEHAHSRRIIHRDIKPENIILAENDSIKVIDFGLARTMGTEGEESTAITQPCAFLGTLAYAAPELFSGAGASARSDVYSLGVILYEMACGVHPFAKLKGAALVAAILAGDERGSKERHPLLSSSVAALIDRCMSREPAVRYRDGAEVAAALRTVQAGEELPGDVSAPPYLAILDFVKIAGAPDLDWLGTGLAETLSADFAKLKSLRIASRSRVHRAIRRVGDPYHDSAAAAELGRELAARWIVTGGYQQIGDKIRITPKLIDASTGDVLSTGKIDGRREDLFDLQDRVAVTVLEALAIGFGTTDQRRILPAETRNMMAYEHYVRGRRQMYEMQNKSMGTAIQHFEQSVALDPGYALAYSGLGTAHALQFLRTSDPEDVARASISLERAIELDPELGEPYPWLANIRGRKNDPAGAFAAGARGVELQPDLPESHYFYAGLHYMLAETRLGDMRSAPRSLAESIRLQPRFHPAWLVLGATAMFVGKHESAVQLLSETVRLEGESDLIYRFVGGRTLLGIAYTRLGEWDNGRAQHLSSLEALKTSDHLYRDTFTALSACGLGDIELRCGNDRTALAHYRHASRIVKERPRMAGSARMLIRAGVGLAAAYAGTGELERARELTNEAAGQLHSVVGQTVTVTFECGLAQLYLALAVAQVRLGRIEQAASCVERARETGWLDLPWLLADSELRPLHEHPVFISFVEELRCAPEIEVPVPSVAQR